MALFDRIQIDERAAAPSAEQTNRIQTNIERALKRVSDTLTTLIGVVFGPSGPKHSKGAVPDPGAVAGSTKFLREDATWAVPPGGGGGTGPQGPQGAPGFFTDAEDGDWPLVMPGPVGASGTTGAAGTAGARGANGLDAEEPETPFVVPGPTGATGATGGAGGPGAQGAQGNPGAPGADADDPEWPLMVPGPTGSPGATGSTGAPGPPGPAYYLDADEPDYVPVIRGPAGPGQATGTAVLDFGAAPGTNIASVAVAGQTLIASTAYVDLRFSGTDSTADHNATEHSILPAYVSLAPTSITPGVGFTAQAATDLRLTGLVSIRWAWSN